jgi:predicted RNA binding protein YcfA (HicA-like mRNA interferase family)
VRGATVGGVNKDVKAFIRRLERAGLVVERSGGGHYRVRTPAGGTVAFVPFSPSTNRWRENTIAQLRQRGIELP